MKDILSRAGICFKKRNNTGASAITGTWELTDENGYDETDAPDGWAGKRFDASFLFEADGTGKYTGGNGGYDLRWELDGDRLTVIPGNGNDPAVYTVCFPSARTIHMESKIKAENNPYWESYNRATYLKK